VWEKIRDEKLLAEAHTEILKSTDGNPPPILDPFCGGGTIPLEAQRLGLEAHASDLNPVAVLITKALIEIPAKFHDQPPVFPGLADSEIRQWKRAEGLAADVRAYGTWMRDEAEKLLSRHYPNATLADGSKATVIAWIWARTVTCPNPACGIEMPLVRTWWLSKRKGKEAFVTGTVVADLTHPSGQRVRFGVRHGKTGAPTPEDDGTVSRTGSRCIACNAPVALEYIRATSRERGLGQQLMAIVAEGDRTRIYLAPDPKHEAAAKVDMPEDLPEGELFDWPGRINVYRYGLTHFVDLFTNRQLVALTTFSDLVTEVHSRVIVDGGTKEYADAVATYLGLVQSKMTNLSSSITTWMSDRGAFRETFARQALPMAWDFAEANVLSDLGGGWLTFLDKEAKVIEALPIGVGEARQADAAKRSFEGLLLNTDPPYYDNIGYSDLSDYFYVWLRRTLRAVYPTLLGTMLVPKADELVANPYRHNGKEGAKSFFEEGFRAVFANARSAASTDYPITVYYAFRQSESDDSGEASTGWETLLEGMIRAGWEITSTWPIRTEGAGRLLAKDTNALASSIVLSLRPRQQASATTDRRGLIAALKSELPDALRRLQQGQIAPVDLPQAAIGPGMAVFSRYGAVLEPDGSKMTVRSALARINDILDEVLNKQEGDFDPTTRFSIVWYRQHGYGTGKFGDADNIARALNTSVDVMDRDGVLTSRAGKVQLIRPEDLSWTYDPIKDTHTSSWECLHHLIKVLERDGIGPAGDFLRAALSRPDGAVDADLIKELSHLLFRIAEGKDWTKDALSFNSLVTSWPEIVGAARTGESASGVQSAFDLEEGDD
jgi:putative DNA methylase